jgi:uncharacterized RmlC-like cupin family protein
MPADKITVIRADEADHDTAQTEGLPRLNGVSAETSDAENIWLGQPTAPPGMDSDPHHHGEAESAGYIISGHARVYYGENYDNVLDMGPGDFAHIPPFLPHLERNLSDTEPIEFVTARTPANIVVNLDEDPGIPPRSELEWDGP